MRFLKVVPALKVQMSVWGVQVGPYGFSAVRVSLVLSGHGQASRSSGSLILIHTHDTAWTGSMAGSPQATLLWSNLDTMDTASDNTLLQLNETQRKYRAHTKEYRDHQP